MSSVHGSPNVVNKAKADGGPFSPAPGLSNKKDTAEVQMSPAQYPRAGSFVQPASM